MMLEKTKIRALNSCMDDAKPKSGAPSADGKRTIFFLDLFEFWILDVHVMMSNGRINSFSTNT